MEKNALVLVVSLYQDGTPEHPKSVKEYRFGETVYTGRQTNEAAAKLTVDKYGADRLVCIASREVLADAKNELGGKTTYEYFRATVEEYARENGRRIPEFICIPVNADDGSEKPAPKLFDELIAALGDCNIYFDTTGGGRDTSTILQLLMKYLEIFGRHFAHAWYSDLNKKVIIDVTEDIGSVIDLLDAVGTFRTTGSCTALKALKTIKDAELLGTIDKMNSFSSAIRLNRVDGLEKIITDMNGCFDKIIASGQLGGSGAEYLLRALMPRLKESFFPDGKADIIGIVRWCIDNDLLQQAMTITTERLPAYLFTQKRIEFHGDRALALKDKKSHEDEHYYLYYAVLFKNLGSEKKRIRAIREQFYNDYRAGRLTSEKRAFWSDFETIISGLPDNTDHRILFKRLCRLGQNARGAMQSLISFLLPKSVNDLEQLAWQYMTARKVQLADLLNEPVLKIKEDTNLSFNEKILYADGITSATEGDFTINGSLESFKKTAVGYVYIKTLRNKANHASDSSAELFSDAITILKKHGYSTEEADIAEDILRLIDSVCEPPV